MFTTIIIGIFIGICISAPTGPIGVLCIRRTIMRGRNHGIATGVGATISDLFYACLVASSMGFILNFIESHQFIIQSIGSLIIAIYGIHIMRGDHNEQFQRTLKPSDKEKNIWGDLISGFALCFSNPLIIFLFIGLFSQFPIFEANNTIIKSVVGMVSISIGAMIWWYALTLIVNIFRNKFNARGFQILNRTTGSLLVLLAVIAFVSIFL
ncbi:MAG: LysE family transporter [bacterium]